MYVNGGGLMFKKIPGNKRLRINLKGDIVDIFGRPTFLEKDNDGRVILEMFDSKVAIELEQLALLAWYELGNLLTNPIGLSNIAFCKVESKVLRLKCGNIMYFNKPIEYLPGFRYIPCYPRYAIDECGTILDTESGMVVDKLKIDDDGYAGAYIYSPDANANRWVRVHRLKALAWIANSDYNVRPYINHINGIRSDNALGNLEWCSAKENAEHAIATGLIATQLKMKVRDVVTGKITTYDSISDLSKSLGTGSGLSSTTISFKLPGHLWKGRYEIKHLEDESPWYHEDEDVVHSKKAHYTITVTNVSSEDVQKFNSVRLFRKHYGLWAKSDNIDLLIDAFKTKYPGHEVTYVRNALAGPYVAVDVTTNEHFIFNSIKESAKFIGRGTSEIQADLFRKNRYIYNSKWVIRVHDDQTELAEYSHKPNRYNNVEITYLPTREKYVANSIKAAAKHCGIDAKSIAKYINTGNSIKQMEFRALS